jgi:endonuclease/exonuclease/phosphatase family metal-dependent hydrolase
MAFNLRRFSTRLFFFLNMVVAVLFLIACVSPYLNPAEWWFVGFSGLALPWLLFILLAFLIGWLTLRPKRAIPTLAVLLIGIPNIRVLFGTSIPREFRLEKQQRTIRLMDWNVRSFTPYYTEKFNNYVNINEQAMMDEIRRFDPDVLCMQEFFTTDGDWGADNIKVFGKELGFRYVSFLRIQNYMNKMWNGNIILSKYPIIDSTFHVYDHKPTESAEGVAAADILIDGDTVRVYTTHLQSFSFRRKDYMDLRKIRETSDSGLVASKNIFYKMRTAFQSRASQAQEMADLVKDCRYPHIVCGDLNDVPNSFAYFTVRGDMHDTFLDKGTGLGKSFHSGSSHVLDWLPTLRIDYILASHDLKTLQYTQMNRKLSDHRALVADLQLPGRK